MKRSEINQVIKEMELLLKQNGWHLPDFCYWTPEDWNCKGKQYNEIRHNMLGWDITDYGLGNFDRIGLALITLRNGNVNDENYKKKYAEKLMLLKENQSACMHFHYNKMEDIINRGGGNALIKVYNADVNGEYEKTNVIVNIDGEQKSVPAGMVIQLAPGQSMAITPYMYHDFHVEAGSGYVLLGEVSTCNDDEKDNRFYEPVGRFPEIEEDEKPYHLLSKEYPKADW